jgi:Spy/CpxP family protein refolding chaperone
MHRTTILILCLALASVTACPGHSPYSGMQSRDIKALSASDIEGIRAGRGMSLALAAELNGYPGPMHVLELADKLELAQTQRAATQELFQRMKAAAIAAGEEFVRAERQLDGLFAASSATQQQLTEALARVAQAQAKLRGTHLQAHLEQVRILTPEQVVRYN